METLETDFLTRGLKSFLQLREDGLRLELPVAGVKSNILLSDSFLSRFLSQSLCGHTVRFDELAIDVALKLRALGPAGLVDDDQERTTRSACSVRKRLTAKTSVLQKRMKQCQQTEKDFEDVEALWGYVDEKFVLRACMAFDILAQLGLSALGGLPEGSGVRIAAMGGGPAAELLSAIVARDITGGRNGKLAVYEWVDGWRSIVEGLSTVIQEEIEYHRCDVTKPLHDASNEALQSASVCFDLLIFSYVLQEAGPDSLTLLQDLWVAWPEMAHVLVLDAGQPRGGRSVRLRRPAGAIGRVADWGSKIGANVRLPHMSLDGQGGVLLSR